MADHGSCRQCGAAFGPGPFSKHHARSVDAAPATEAYVWCFKCGWITRFESSGMQRLLSKCGLDANLQPKTKLTIEMFFRHHTKFANGKEIEEELLWRISRCVSNWFMGEDEDAERRAWGLARTKLPPAQQVEYCKMIATNRVVRPMVAMDWLLELKKTSSPKDRARISALADPAIDALRQLDVRMRSA